MLNNNSYKGWLELLKQRIQASQIKAAVKVNAELLELYWILGQEIVVKQQESNWGDAIIDQLSKDLTAAFPGMKGFSRANLFFIRKWYLFYQKTVSQPVRLLPESISETSRFVFVSQLVRQIPWGHNREIITKCKDLDEAIFYVEQTIANNWSRSILLAQIQTGLYERQGKAIQNFSSTLPLPMADLARETFKSLCFRLFNNRIGSA